MNNELIVERLAKVHHQALLREAETYRQFQPAAATKHASRMRNLLRALSWALRLALLGALVAPLGIPTQSTLSDNSTLNGGVIYNNGSLPVVSRSFASNSATGVEGMRYGGGIDY